MANRAYILILVLMVWRCTASAQTLTFQQTDSTMLLKYNSADWKGLIEIGDRAAESGIDYPIMRLRMAWAQYNLGNYSGALAQYKKVLAKDSHNQTAHYYSVLCNKYLDRYNEAYIHAKYIDTTTLAHDQITPYGAMEAGFETGIKENNNNNRGTASYTMATLSNRLGWNFQLENMVGYYSQSITTGTTTAAVVQIPGAPQASANNGNSSFTNSQFEYYGKLSYAVSPSFTLFAAYHFLNTSYVQSSVSGNVGVFGMRYSHPYFSLQADVNAAQINSTSDQQYNGQLTLYPLGNLNLYTISRGSIQTNGISQTIFSQAVGFKTIGQLWLQLQGSFGKLDDYIEADGKYVYNAIDVTQNKAGATAFYALGQHAVIYLNYTFEKKQDHYLNTNFNQNSITGGFTWKF